MDRLISEQAVIKILILLFIGSENFKVAINSIKAMPSAEPKTGHWIERRNRATGHIEIVCSECGAEKGYPYDDYCGNCGAKMVEPQERSEK